MYSKKNNFYSIAVQDYLLDFDIFTNFFIFPKFFMNYMIYRDQKQINITELKEFELILNTTDLTFTNKFIPTFIQIQITDYFSNFRISFPFQI